MKKNLKETSVKITPLKGKFFDIKPPIGGSRPPTSRSLKEFGRFFVIALIVFFGLNISNIYLKGKDVAVESGGYAMAGFDSLQNAISSLENKDIKGAFTWFKKAEVSFNDLSESTRYLTAQANSLINESLYLDTANKLIESAITVSKMGQELISSMDRIQEIPQKFIDGSSDLILLIHEEKVRFDKIFQDVIILQNNMTTLNNKVLPQSLQEKIIQGQDQIGQLIGALIEVDANFETVLTLLGDAVPHRYLVLLQNNHELRATGGFIGSYMIIDINDGVITKMETHDVYQSDGQLTDVVEPPAGIDQVSERWFMRDANYSPDFPTAAKQIMWFLEHSQGPSVDTVIALDQSVIEEILLLTGPIVLKSFPFQIRADNFNKILSFHIEAKLSETGSPKQILFDMIPVFKDKFLSMGNFTEVINLVKNMVDERHIQAYSKEPKVQALAERFKIDGKMTTPVDKTDFLALVTTSIGGNKSDQYIETDINHHTEISHTGLVMDYLEITKNHTWTEDDFAGWQKLANTYGTGKTSLETLRFIQGEGENVDYMRVYVPKGSELVKTDGVDKWDIEVSEDLGYTVFGFVFGPVVAGTSETVKLQYELPYNLSFYPTDNYRLIAQKQAGAENMTLNKTLVTADSLNVVKSFPTSSDPFTLMPDVQISFDKNQIFISAIQKM